ncbi:MAG: GNAT family N-acetyltransferase [Pseudomonadota bacterium]
MKLRAARDDDIRALAEVAVASYRATFAELLEPEALAKRDAVFFEAHLRDRQPGVRVAVSDRRIVGFSQVTGSHLDMLFVAPWAQQSGAGTALLRGAEDDGIRTLECFRDNRPARAFYERHGWKLGPAYEREFLGRMRAFVLYEKP